MPNFLRLFLNLTCCVFLVVLLYGSPAHADFIITSAIVEFNQDGPRQHDIELVGSSAESQYIVTEISEVKNPGAPDETRQVVKDPTQSMLLVTPDKTVLAGNNRKVLRFVLLKDPDASEHIYRVAVKPVIKGVANNSAVGLKILVGYEVLVIVRPSTSQPNYTAERQGQVINIINHGNTNILFQNGQQCVKVDDCKSVPAARVYPGGAEKIMLPLTVPASYTIWDGKTSTDKRFD